MHLDVLSRGSAWSFGEIDTYVASETSVCRLSLNLLFILNQQWLTGHLMSNACLHPDDRAFNRNKKHLTCLTRNIHTQIYTSLNTYIFLQKRFPLNRQRNESRKPWTWCLMFSKFEAQPNNPAFRIPGNKDFLLSPATDKLKTNQEHLSSTYQRRAWS